jgi:hypothetical protein
MATMNGHPDPDRGGMRLPAYAFLWFLGILALFVSGLSAAAIRNGPVSAPDIFFFCLMMFSMFGAFGLFWVAVVETGIAIGLWERKKERR